MNCNVCGNEGVIEVTTIDTTEAAFNVFIRVARIAKGGGYEGRASQKPQASEAVICKACLIKAIKESK